MVEQKKVNRPLDQALASHQGLRTSPRKANLVLQMIRGQHVGDALRSLTVCRKRIAQDIKKVVQSAVANAENNHNLDIDRLYVQEATVGKGLVMKRWHARARGRGARIKKPFSNVRIIVQQREG